MLGNQLRLEGALAVSGHLNRQFVKLTLQGLPALAVAGVSGQILDRLILAMTEVIGHLGFQCFLNQKLRDLLEQPAFANQVFRLSVVSQQAVQ